MEPEVLIICNCALLLYYMVATVLYFTQVKNREFFLMVAFPLPVAVILLFIYFLYFDVDDIGDYGAALVVLIALSVLAGMFVLYHCFLEHKKRDRVFYGKLLTAIALLLIPFLLYSSVFRSLMTGLFLFCGIALGILGFSLYFSNRRIGLMYVYTSLVFMVIIPVISLGVAKFYLDNFQSEIIYRRAPDNVVTCHVPAITIVPEPEGPQFTVFFSGIYIALYTMLASFRKNRLERRLRQEGVIPGKFFQIIEQREFK